MGLLHAPTLEGDLVRLEPLRHRHAQGLAAAAAADRSTFGFTRVPDGIDDTLAYIEELLGAQASGTVIPFAQVLTRDNRVVGATRFMGLRFVDEEATPFSVEIGGTWLAASAQRSGVNSEAKSLLVNHAFTTWGVRRVEFRTDARNTRSRQAIERAGAQFEGVLRRFEPSLVAGEELALRDTAVFSILAP